MIFAYKLSELPFAMGIDFSIREASEGRIFISPRPDMRDDLSTHTFDVSASRVENKGFMYAVVAYQGQLFRQEEFADEIVLEEPHTFFHIVSVWPGLQEVRLDDIHTAFPVRHREFVCDLFECSIKGFFRNFGQRLNAAIVMQFSQNIGKYGLFAGSRYRLDAFRDVVQTLADILRFRSDIASGSVHGRPQGHAYLLIALGNGGATRVGELEEGIAHTAAKGAETSPMLTLVVRSKFELVDTGDIGKVLQTYWHDRLSC